ncbi:MAG: hypothetical protein ACHQK8_09240 [Bacteroidia bacterium]
MNNGEWRIKTIKVTCCAINIFDFNFVQMNLYQPAMLHQIRLADFTPDGALNKSVALLLL